ncbi:hypothetical protein BEWA_008020 [Theileria equi strain WA]|uniref:Uncharacterized protein n=1 Tax=Theileria equi strain WA TaxID=1537102 RepID=L0B0N4_THEEQ|nr:hypothetical protein BEWA_008020 [Theileria equi strain WA]AFZ81392.1 hypothetical protein BEWA_008020 [Theileria equi strain WA]|eukprot:XP_004831058.1 hypothetical protein BEWA_008020 [Theileria equi strain WA]
MKLLPTNEDYIFSYLPDKLEEGNIKAIGALIKGFSLNPSFTSHLEPVAKDQLNELLDTGSLEIKPPFVPPMELSGDGKNYNDEVKGTTEILNGANPETEVSSNEKEDSELRDNLIQNLSEVNASKTMFGAN